MEIQLNLPVGDFPVSYSLNLWYREPSKGRRWVCCMRPVSVSPGTPTITIDEPPVPDGIEYLAGSVCLTTQGATVLFFSFLTVEKTWQANESYPCRAINTLRGAQKLYGNDPGARPIPETVSVRFTRTVQGSPMARPKFPREAILQSQTRFAEIVSQTFPGTATEDSTMRNCIISEFIVQRLFGDYPTGCYYDPDLLRTQLGFTDEFFEACIEEGSKTFEILRDDPPETWTEAHLPALLHCVRLPVARLRYALDFLYDPLTGNNAITEFFNGEQIFNWGTYDCEDGSKYLLCALLHLKLTGPADRLKYPNLVRFQRLLQGYYITNAIVGASAQVIYSPPLSPGQKPPVNPNEPLPHVTCLLIRKDLLQPAATTPAPAPGCPFYLVESTCCFHPNVTDSLIGQTFARHWREVTQATTTVGMMTLYASETNFVGANRTYVSPFLYEIYMLVCPEIASAHDGTIRFLLAGRPSFNSLLRVPETLTLVPLPVEQLSKLDPAIAAWVRYVENLEPPPMILKPKHIPEPRSDIAIFRSKQARIIVAIEDPGA